MLVTLSIILILAFFLTLWLVSRDFRLSEILYLYFFFSILFCLIVVKCSADDVTAYRALSQTTLHLSIGSGSVVKGLSGKRYILTNWHVCIESTFKHNIFANYEDGRLLSGPVVKRDAKSDLCAARVTEKVTALHLGEPVGILDKVYTRGYPNHILSESKGSLGEQVMWSTFFPIEELGECPPEFDKRYDFYGILKGCIATFRSVVSSLYSRPGSSGSPVVNDKGELVGVVSSWHQDNDHDAGLVPYDELKQFLEAL